MTEWINYIETNPRLMYTDTPDGNRIWRSESGALTVEVLPNVELVDNCDVLLPLELDRQTITDLTPPPETEKPKRKKKARKKP
jgi:hypothetical protein